MQDFGSETEEIAVLHKMSLGNRLILKIMLGKAESERDDILDR